MPKFPEYYEPTRECGRSLDRNGVESRGSVNMGNLSSLHPSTQIGLGKESGIDTPIR